MDVTATPPFNGTASHQTSVDDESSDFDLNSSSGYRRKSCLRNNIVYFDSVGFQILLFLETVQDRDVTETPLFNGTARQQSSVDDESSDSDLSSSSGYRRKMVEQYC